MVTDSHTHIGPSGDATTDQRVKRMLELLDHNHVDGAIVLPLAGLMSDCFDHKADNDFVFDFCGREPARLFPAFAVNPLLGMKALDEIKRCRNDRGLRLLKLHPWLQGFSIASDPMNKVAELCQQLGVTIVFHDGTPPYCTPLQLARLCRDFPDLKVISGHGGLDDLWSDSIAAAKRYRNYLICLCGLPLGQMQRIVDEAPPEKICIGSDFINLAEDTLWYRWSVWRKVSIPNESRRIIEDETPRSILGVSE